LVEEKSEYLKHGRIGLFLRPTTAAEFQNLTENAHCVGKKHIFVLNFAVYLVRTGLARFSGLTAHLLETRRTNTKKIQQHFSCSLYRVILK
jgi:hypothetical protein